MPEEARILGPAYYATRARGWRRDVWAVLHPPYTAWHLSYVVIGAGLAPSLDVKRLAATVLAFFLAVGISAHALDELRGRPLQTDLPAKTLWAAAGPEHARAHAAPQDEVGHRHADPARRVGDEPGRARAAATPRGRIEGIRLGRRCPRGRARRHAPLLDREHPVLAVDAMCHACRVGAEASDQSLAQVLGLDHVVDDQIRGKFVEVDVLAILVLELFALCRALVLG